MDIIFIDDIDPRSIDVWARRVFEYIERREAIVEALHAVDVSNDFQSERVHWHVILAIASLRRVSIEEDS